MAALRFRKRTPATRATSTRLANGRCLSAAPLAKAPEHLAGNSDQEVLQKLLDFLGDALDVLAELDVHGRPHHLMQADLQFYPPFADPQTGFLALTKQAA